MACAQRADENAVTAAHDAFGTSIGLQNVGLYSPNDARGFSPQQAGNLRIEGLYFDQQTWVTNDCMVRETTMRVGISAQSYSFPAPTGIADLSLRTPRDKALSSAVLTRGPFNTATADVETQIPLVDRALGVDLCAGYRKNFEVDTFHESHAAVFGATFRWRPTANIEIIPFWSYTVGGARQIVPEVYTDEPSASRCFARETSARRVGQPGGGTRPPTAQSRRACWGIGGNSPPAYSIHWNAIHSAFNPM